jgi:hypothetical protein
MKKKTIIIISLLIVIIAIAIPVTGFLLLAFYPWEPETKGKIVEAIKIIDLKNLPKGRFQKVSIATNDFDGYKGRIFFEVPADKMIEFEADFRRYVQNAMPLEGIITCLPDKLRIQTGKGKYSADICYDDYGVIIQRSSFFHRGFSSSELRKVFYDAGLKYSAGYSQKEVNEP